MLEKLVFFFFFFKYFEVAHSNEYTPLHRSSNY